VTPRCGDTGAARAFDLAAVRRRDAGTDVAVLGGMKHIAWFVMALSLGACGSKSSDPPVALGISGWHLNAPAGVEATWNADDSAFYLKDPAETSRSGVVFPFAGEINEDAVRSCDGADPKIEKLDNGYIATCGAGSSWSSKSVVKSGDEVMQCSWYDSQRGTRDAVRAVCASLSKK
jgi:hypothetical protein